MSGAHTLSLSLVSHTNAGKTTLARTLLGRDIGEVRDAAHVTEQAEPHSLVQTPEGDRLLLWDTPGFGDSLRLARRMASAGNPIGWLLSEVWDRWRDRAFWSSQRAIRHVLAEADVVLYLANASEAPEDAGYLDAELQVLALVGKPVIVVLNQLGPAGADVADSAMASLTERWHRRLAGAPLLRAVLPLDAFSRCWVQEDVLWSTVATVLAAPQQAAFARLHAAWRRRQHDLWQAAVDELAQRLAHAARDREPVPAAGWSTALRGPLRTLGGALGWPGEGRATPTDQAMAALAERLDGALRRSNDALIRLHGLDGRAGDEVQARLARHYAMRQPLDEGRAALWGGLLTGALAGLKADLASGGLTMGGGLLAGGVLGALGAAGAARGVNRVRGLDQVQVAWDNRVLDALLASALLAYLAVAHHGRGRGAWVALEPPTAWTEAVDAVLGERQPQVQALWRLRQAALTRPAGQDLPAADGLDEALVTLLQALTAALLRRLYPQAAGWVGT